MKKKICIVCPYPKGVAPSQRLKFEQYYPSFQDDGWEIEVYPFQTLKFWNIVYQRNKMIQKIFWTIFGYIQRIMLIFKLRNFDLVYIHLFVTPFGWPLFEWLYRKISKKIIFDIDDLVYLGNTSEANSWISKLKGKQKPIFLMKQADYIITTTPYLETYCRQYNECVVGIPPTLDENIIFPLETKKEDKIVIGWSGSHSTVKYLSIVKQALLNISMKFDIEFIVFGVRKLELKGIKTKPIPWTPESENNVFNQMDIALYPQTKEQWSEGKYGGKMIQYLAAGLPMIISHSNELVPQIIQNHENGIIVENDTQSWEEAIIQLIEDDHLREKISKNARKLFLEKFSIQANKKKYLEILNTTSQSESRK